MVTIKLALSDQNYKLTISQRYFVIWLWSANFVLIFNKLLIWFNCKTTLWEKMIFSFLLQQNKWGFVYMGGGGGGGVLIKLPWSDQNSKLTISSFGIPNSMKLSHFLLLRIASHIEVWVTKSLLQSTISIRDRQEFI